MYYLIRNSYDVFGCKLYTIDSFFRFYITDCDFIYFLDMGCFRQSAIFFFQQMQGSHFCYNIPSFFKLNVRTITVLKMESIKNMNESLRFLYNSGYHVFMSDIKTSVIDKVQKYAEGLKSDNCLEICQWFHNKLVSIGNGKQFWTEVDNLQWFCC